MVSAERDPSVQALNLIVATELDPYGPLPKVNEWLSPAGAGWYFRAMDGRPSRTSHVKAILPPWLRRRMPDRFATECQASPLVI